MPNQEVILTDQEKQIIEEVQTMLGLSSIEETLEHLTRARTQEMLAKLAGQELKSKRHLF
ncbi:hypothetical protein ABLT80_09105 [Acinetobacter schindleri]|uniref:hypothetical protein n=1 Tax=Acinetobacter schindleri TaxID=108981 RepID=UPI00161969B7|nr:hypothetical protein [Acinetobacter schindleri]MBB4835444.1 putative ArsR family transcriptional regulator [Acinetobacter schindleri]WDE16917.1 hypothetical protein KMZ14_05060 [Acinetobacter schindleri]